MHSAIVESCPIYDVGFMLDESGSVSRTNWRKEEVFTNQIAKMANIAPTGGRASVITFHSSANLDIKFNRNTNYDAFARDVDNLNQNRGGTNIIRALRMGLDHMFQTRNGMRQDSSKIAILITDGQDSNRASSYSSIAADYKRRNIRLIVIGVGSVSRSKLERLVQNQKEDLFISGSFNTLLQTFVKSVGQTICTGK